MTAAAAFVARAARGRRFGRRVAVPGSRTDEFRREAGGLFAGGRIAAWLYHDGTPPDPNPSEFEPDAPCCDAVHVSVRRGRRWRRGRIVSARGVTADPPLGVALPRGRTLLVWQVERKRPFQYVIVSRRGRIGRTRSIASDATAETLLDATRLRGGRVLLTYRASADFKPTVRVTGGRPGRRFTRPRTVLARQSMEATFVATDARGAQLALVGDDVSVRAYRRPAGARGFRHVRRLARGHVTADGLASDGQGRAIAVWHKESHIGGSTLLRYAFGSTEAGFGSGRTFAEHPMHLDDVTSFGAAVGTSGHVLMTAVLVPNRGGGVYAGAGWFGGIVGRAERISRSATVTAGPPPVVDELGLGGFAWHADGPPATAASLFRP